jgi:hypothetical protein
MFVIIHRSIFLRKFFNRCFLHFKKAKTIANKIIAGIRKTSEFAKFKNRVKNRILPANTRKNIV